MDLATDLNQMDIVCFSHLRWDFVYQRPQHLMSRHATRARVFYFEEPVWGAEKATLRVSTRQTGVRVVVPELPDTSKADADAVLQALLEDFLAKNSVKRYCLWYYTPMAMAWTKRTRPVLTVYDCMDELSAFKGAHPDLRTYEADLFKFADLVFTGGYSLYESKKNLHPNIYPFPSSIDVQHFARARVKLADPSDQASIPNKRIGFAGVIDERMDLNLLARIADLRPQWQFVMIGPIVKINPADLPRRENINYLGMKPYDELPAYFSNWDAAMLPFARNESTKYISPTKTPEYLAAGLPVVSTAIQDVVRPYGALGLVHIADDAASFVKSMEDALTEDGAKRLQQVDALLSSNSWTRTWRRMSELMEDIVSHNNRVQAPEATRPSFLNSITARAQ
jgi:UDP-galactopyranose mutase